MNNRKALFALGRLKTGQMNKTEAMYSVLLDEKLFRKEIAWWKFEGLKLRLADNTFFTVDFFVMLPDGELQAHEVKGFMNEDANVKIKVAASMYPFRFFLIRTRPKRDGGGWSVAEVAGSA